MELKKLTKEDIDQVRHIDGFPIAKDEDIIALSKAPYYTACPNPFIEDFIKENCKPYDEETDDYHKEPYAFDVSEGKSDPFYNIHTYHTKVPYKAIMRYILHFTEPGDIVMDGFCGSGMTGVAAKMCGSSSHELRMEMESEMPNIKWGYRNSILSDLAPAATFIASNYTSSINEKEFYDTTEIILAEVENKWGWMYETNPSNKEISFLNDSVKGKIIYTVWSDVFICPNCGNEIVFWDVSPLNAEERSERGKFACLDCGVKVSKRECERSKNFVERNGIVSEVSKQVPVMINYEYQGKRYEKKPDIDDLSIINSIESRMIENWYPTDLLPTGYNTEQPLRSHGIRTVDLFYTKRNLIILSELYTQIQKYPNIPVLKFWLTSLDHGIGKRVKHGNWSFPMSTLSGTLYIPSLSRENNPLHFYQNKAKKMTKIFSNDDANKTLVTTQSSTDLRNIPDKSIDYIFVDPPFGSNLNYSELSCGWESWLKVKTDNKSEAIMNSVQKKKLVDYQELIEKCLREFNRVLKPNRWITIEFHNSQNSVWNAIQQAINKSNFIMADVRILDKQTGSHKQVVKSILVCKLPRVHQILC